MTFKADPGRVAALGLLAGLLAGASAFAQSPPTSFADLANYKGADREKMLYEGAKKEGKVSFYSSIVLDMDQALIKGFKEKYPGVDVDLYAAPDEQIETRLFTEYKAGRHDVDSISMGGAAQDVVKQIGAQAWDSPELEEYPTGDLGHTADKTIATILQFGRVFTYNTKLVAEKDVPHQWEDLLKPYWKNKLVLVTGPSVMPLMLGGLIHEWGRDRAVDYVTKLGKQNITVLGVQPAAVTGQVASGDFLGTYGAVHRVTILQKTGAPIGYSVLGDTVFTQIQTMQLPPTPAHPNAALLFTDFILSSAAGEGQQIFKDFGYPPTNPKVADNSGPLATHPKWIMTTELLQANLDDWSKVVKQAIPQ